MYQHILVPLALDHLHQDDPSLSVAQRLLAKGGKITLLNVIEDIPAYLKTHIPEETFQATKDRARQELEAIGAKVGDNSTVALVSGKPSSAILEYADRHDAGCIVIASHTPGVQDYFLGSTAARVVRHAKCCVHVLR